MVLANLCRLAALEYLVTVFSVVDKVLELRDFPVPLFHQSLQKDKMAAITDCAKISSFQKLKTPSAQIQTTPRDRRALTWDVGTQMPSFNLIAT
jgi:hypothetical protein